MLSRRQLLALPLACYLRAAVDAPGDGAMLWQYFLREVDRADERRRRKLESLRSPADLDALRTRVRRTLLEMIGGFPERSPLNARHVGTLARSGYVIEKVIFESRPQFYVTANVYRPKSEVVTGLPACPPAAMAEPSDRGQAGRLVTTRRPAVIQSCGHYEEGKAAPDYQSACIGLARKGFVALIFDPVGQGERLMYRDESGRGAAAEHVIAGKPCYLLGRTLAHFRIWDAIRALDYLESRPDVDPARMGMLGHSGGGMVALLTAPLENRLRAVMSCCAVTSFCHKTRALLIADPEQILPGIYKHGIDHPELIASIAPRAFLIGAALRDFVPLDGTRRTFQETKRAFELAGAADRLGLVETDDEHKLNRQLREACYAWMLKHLAEETGPVPRDEPDLEIETEATLRCTPSGCVMDLPGARSVFDINRDYARDLRRMRRAEAADSADLRGLLGLPPEQSQPARRGESSQEFRIESEPGIELPATLTPGSNNHDALLVLIAEQGRNSSLATDFARYFARAGRAVLGLDLRGWGETKPVLPELKARFAWEDFFAYRGFELGRPLLGMRVHDLLAAIRLMRREYTKVYAIGLEAGGLVALHAAALESSISGAATFRSLVSYHDVLEHPAYAEPVSSFVPGALTHYDLPLLAQWIRPRPCVNIDPYDSARRPVSAQGRGDRHPCLSLRGREPADRPGGLSPRQEEAARLILEGLREQSGKKAHTHDQEN